jgi:hypothetical protein
VKHFINKPRAALLTFMLIGFASLGTVRAQTYYYSTPVLGSRDSGSGYQEIPFADTGHAGDPGRLFSGLTSTLSFGTVNGTLAYNPVASTMHLSGNVSISYDTFSSSFNDNQMVGGSLVPAQVSVSYSIGNVNNGVLSFDSGVVQHQFGSTTQWGINLQLPISGNYSFATGGQTYNGVFSYTLNLPTILNLQSVSSSSLNFSQDTSTGGESLIVPLAQVSADNGAQLNLTARDPSDGDTFISWHQDNVTAEVPEPGSMAIVGLGLLLAVVCRRPSLTRR